MPSESQGSGGHGQSSPCPGCGKAIPQARSVCPHCGFDRRAGAKRQPPTRNPPPKRTVRKPGEVQKAVSPSTADAGRGADGKRSAPPVAQAQEPKRPHVEHRWARRKGRSRRFLGRSLPAREIILLAIFGALSFWLWCLWYGTPRWLSGQPEPPKGVEHYDLGVEAQFRGHPDEAIRQYTKAIEMNPAFAMAYVNRGVAHMDTGDLDAAMRDFNQAIEVDPKLPHPYDDRGLLLIKRGEPEAAIQDFAKAIEIDPRDAGAFSNWAKALVALGRYAEACEKCAKAAEIDPRLAAAYQNWGVALASMGKRAEAGKKLTRAAELNPSLKPLIEETRRRLLGKEGKR